ncbi:hypothetical protein CFN79_03940 [Chromobacterium vaccinii]|nr:hypothetical protein CFN79_03940 [Chromobacterium vaccinii]
MGGVLASLNAITAMAASAAAMNLLLANTSALTTLVASSAAMAVVVASPAAMNAVFASAAARQAVWGSDIAVQALANDASALAWLVNNKATTPAARTDTGPFTYYSGRALILRHQQLSTPSTNPGWFHNFATRRAGSTVGQIQTTQPASSEGWKTNVVAVNPLQFNNNTGHSSQLQYVVMD